MKCEDALILISGHLDNINTEEEEKELQAHLCVCESCRDTMQMFRDNDSALLALTEKAPQDLCSNVMKQIRKEKTKKSRRPWFGLAIAAALMVVIGVSSLMQKPAAEASDEPQTISTTTAQPQARAMSLVNGEALARQIADERGAEVVLIHELYYEVETFDCESLEQGAVLYILPDHDAAIFLSETYGCVIYEPEERAQMSYALLVP